MKFGQFISYYRRKNFIKKFYKTCDLKTCSRPFSSTNSISKPYLWGKLLILDIIVKLLKVVQVSMQTSSDSFSQWILWKLNCSQVTFFIEFFNNFVILHKLAKFHCQTVFASQVIPMKYVLWFMLEHFMKLESSAKWSHLAQSTSKIINKY